MKIALLAPPWIALPPKGYGGIESVVYNLEEGLVKKGHEVLTLATGDSNVSSKLNFFYKQSLGVDMLLEKGHNLFFLNHISYLLKNLPGDIDIIHNHCEYSAMHFLDNSRVPFAHTLHGAFYSGFDNDRAVKDSSTRSYQETLGLFKTHPFVSISDFQRTGKKDLNYIKTVYNGIEPDNYTFKENSSDYISWLGRYSPLKGLDKAIEAAKRANKNLKIATIVHHQRQETFNKEIMPLIDTTTIQLTGEITNFQDKNNLLGNSKLFLFPIQWEEPFGLVMTEAMMCGTPVVAFARGSVMEIVKDGDTGFIVNPSDTDIRGDFIIKKTGMEGLVEAINKIYALSSDEYANLRKACRKHVESKFTVQKMVDDYESVYNQILQTVKQ